MRLEELPQHLAALGFDQRFDLAVRHRRGFGSAELVRVGEWSLRAWEPSVPFCARASGIRSAQCTRSPIGVEPCPGLSAPRLASRLGLDHRCTDRLSGHS
jgi:hypothetical protein